MKAISERVAPKPETALQRRETDKMADDKETMTLNLSSREMAVLNELATAQDLSKTAVMRQALRVYQMIHERLKAGEKMSFSGDQQRIVEFIGPGFGQ